MKMSNSKKLSTFNKYSKKEKKITHQVYIHIRNKVTELDSFKKVKEDI